MLSPIIMRRVNGHAGIATSSPDFAVLTQTPPDVGQVEVAAPAAAQRWRSAALAAGFGVLTNRDSHRGTPLKK